MRLIDRLNKPYYSNTSIVYRFVQAVAVGGFVSLFLIVFEPFQISGFGENWRWFAIGFGGVTIAVMIFLNSILPLFFKKYFEAENWTVKKEIVHSCLNMISIGAANCIYFLYLVIGDFSWEVFLRFQFFTFCVGILPIVVLALYRERKDFNRFSSLSQAINTDYKAKIVVEGTLNENEIQILSKNKNENITLLTSNLILIKAMDNYLEVYSNQGKDIVRNTLKNVEVDLEVQGQFFRCHKSYLINLDKVESISGNAQGYKLRLENYPHEVPVSRSLNDEIQNRLLSLT